MNRYAFERNNPYGRIDPTGHNPAVVLGLLILGVGLGTAIYEASVQIDVTGRIYSWSRIGKAFGSGIFSGVVDAAGIGLTFMGHPATVTAGLGLTAYGIYSTAQTAKEAEEAAQQQKALDDLEKMKEETDTDDIKCEVIDCSKDGGVGAEETNQPSGSPNSVSTSSQADSTKAISQSLQQSQNIINFGYNANIGAYITSSGRLYPTNNPNFVPSSEGGSGNQFGGGCRAWGNAKCPD